MRTLKISAVVACIAFISFAATAFAADSGLKISDTYGKVMVKASPSTEWTDAKEGQALSPKDAIKTGANGRVKMVFSDKSAIALKSKTELAVDQLIWTEAERKASVKLDIGTMLAVINKHENRSDFKIITPTSVCAVRGSELSATVNPDGSANYLTSDNTSIEVTITGTDQVVVVTDYSRLDVPNVTPENAGTIIPTPMSGPDRDGLTMQFSAMQSPSNLADNAAGEQANAQGVGDQGTETSQDGTKTVDPDPTTQPTPPPAS